MAIAQVSNGAVVAGTTSLSIPYPSVSSGDLILMFVVNKYPANAPTKPAVFTLPANNQFSGGAGASGNDAGQVYTTVWYKISDGTETGNVSVTITSGNSALGFMVSYSKDPTKSWNIACVGGSDNTGGATPMSVTADANPGITAGDYVVVTLGINGDVNVPTGGSLTATGITGSSSASLVNTVTAGGQDCAMAAYTAFDIVGTASAAPVVTATSATSSTNGPSGSAVIVRLREDVPAANIDLDPMGMMGFFGL